MYIPRYGAKNCLPRLHYLLVLAWSTVIHLVTGVLGQNSSGRTANLGFDVKQGPSQLFWGSGGFQIVAMHGLWLANGEKSGRSAWSGEALRRPLELAAWYQS